MTPSLLTRLRGHHRVPPALRHGAEPRGRRRCDMVFVVMVTDGESLGVTELLDSIGCYAGCDHEVVVVDDCTRDGSAERAAERGCWMVRNPRKAGRSGVALSIRRGFYRALAHFDSPLILKMDPDALLIGPGLHGALRDHLDAHPRAGMLGNYRYDCDGSPRDFDFWRERMARIRRRLGEPLARALANGYPLGAGVQGGAYAMRRDCVAAIDAAGWLTDWHPPYGARRRLAEDHVMTMLTLAAGFEVHDFGREGEPFASGYRALPMSPEALVAAGKRVTHAMKFDDAESLAARRFFAARRAAAHDA